MYIIYIYYHIQLKLKFEEITISSICLFPQPPDQMLDFQDARELLQDLEDRVKFQEAQWIGWKFWKWWKLVVRNYPLLSTENGRLERQSELS